MAQIGLIARAKRGTVLISDVGRAPLAENPARVDSAFLRRYPSFVEFVSRKQSASRTEAAPTGPALMDRRLNAV